jgi:hypothetical protein
LRDVIAEQFLDAFETPPSRFTLDFDALDDPTHGQQQLTFFHRYYDQYPCLPIGVLPLAPKPAGPSSRRAA